MDDPNLSAPAPKVEIVSNSFLQSTQGKLITIIGISILLFILVIIIAFLDFIYKIPVIVSLLFIIIVNLTITVSPHRF